MSPVRILFLGDVLTDRLYDSIVDPVAPFICNLEGPLADSGTPIQGKINIRSKKELFYANFKSLPLAVCLANNHIMDYGDDGFLETTDFLRSYNILFFGAGDSDNNYNNPLVVNMGGVTVGIGGYCQIPYSERPEHVSHLNFRPAPADPDRVSSDIREMKRKGSERIILNFHWGREESSLPITEQIILARKCIDMGADLIIGHHSHTVQPIEEYKSKKIFYSLGNYLFPSLDLMCDFSENGAPQKRANKILCPWNKSSIGATIDIETLGHEITYFKSDDYGVAEKKSPYHRYLSCNLEKDIDVLDQITQQHRKVRRLLRVGYLFWKSPRIPKMGTVINLLKTITGRLA